MSFDSRCFGSGKAGLSSRSITGSFFVASAAAAGGAACCMQPLMANIIPAQNVAFPTDL